MSKLSEHFDSIEFACKCGCGFGTRAGDVSPRLVELLETARAYFDAPVHILSGCRCYAHNEKVGGSRESQHKAGNAADITVDGFKPSEVADYFQSAYPDSYGLGRYVRFTHVDVRTYRARWHG